MIDQTELNNETEIVPKQKRLRKFFLIVVVAFIVGLFVSSLLMQKLNAPTNFVGTVTVEIAPGDSVPAITEKLEIAGVVRSSELLYFWLTTQFDPTQIKASRYVFSEPLTAYQVAERLIAGDFATDLTSVTVVEGESIKKITARLSDEVSWFDRETFVLESVGLEGYLFPETYFVPNDFTTTDFVTLLHDTYHEVISEYESLIASSTLSEKEVVILASIVEREANSEESMRLVAGILLNRLEIGMALQADATIEYVLDEGLHELAPGALAESLREIDSPYNTYIYPGLPPTPIGNPGRTAIAAVLEPTDSDYFYYITGADGEFYYAETYSQHLLNIERYLR